MPGVFLGKMRGKAVLFAILATLTLPTVAEAIGAECSNEIYVRFEKGVVNLPDDKAWHACDSTSIKSEEVLIAIQRAGDVSIQKRFSDADSEQVIVTNPAGIEIVKPTFFGVYKLECHDSIAAGTLARELTELDDVMFAFQNGMRSPQEVIPNDYWFHRQWALRNYGQAQGNPGADIKATYAWEIETGSDSVLIGMLDTGVQTDHPDLAGRVIGDVTYSSDHGTGVAGNIGATANNWMGVAGINWASPMLSKDISSYDYEVIHDKVIAAVDAGCDVINHGYGGYGDALEERMALVYTHNMDVLSVAPAGNDRVNQPLYPAGYPGVVSVSATTNVDGVGDYSNYGSTIDVVAPGGAGITTCRQDIVMQPAELWP
jgi:hypothetical protein